ncbi:hypothetical protein LTR15_012688 [Elasticomyces elasticus]|nr:hypothetical protein LTR15_012688 [Elasticomyces elasticus]
MPLHRPSLKDIVIGNEMTHRAETAEQREIRELRAQVQNLESMVQTMALQKSKPQSSITPRTPHYARDLRGQVSRLEASTMPGAPHFAHLVPQDQPDVRSLQREMAPPIVHEQPLAPQYQAQPQYAPIAYGYIQQHPSVRYVGNDGGLLYPEPIGMPMFPEGPEREPLRIKQAEATTLVNIKEKTKSDCKRKVASDTQHDRRAKKIRSAPADPPQPAAHSVATLPEDRSPFLQNPATITKTTENLWNIPSPLHWGNHHLENCTEPVERRFLEARQKINDKWHSGVKVALPLSLHKSTPFSLSMVVKLGDLADSGYSVEDGMTVAHLALVEQWNERVSKLPPGNRLFVTTSKSETDAKQSSVLSVEGYIQENVYGLMLEDVERAMQITAPQVDITASEMATATARRGPIVSEGSIQFLRRAILAKDQERREQGMPGFKRKSLRNLDYVGLFEAMKAAKQNGNGGPHPVLKPKKAKTGPSCTKATKKMINHTFAIRDKQRKDQGMGEAAREIEKQKDREELTKATLTEKRIMRKEIRRNNIKEISEARELLVEAKKEAGQTTRTDWRLVLNKKIVEATGSNLKFD